MIEQKYYNTKEIAAMFNKNVPAVLKYARTKENIKTEGKDRNTRYFWNEENINEYKDYLEKIKDHSNYNYKHNFKETDKIDTLYRRLYRAKQRNDVELMAKIREDLKEFKAKYPEKVKQQKKAKKSE